MIYFMRHGKDDERFIGGWSSVPLLPEGRKEVLERGMWIQKNLAIKKIISSPIPRAMETANLVNQFLQVPLFYADALKEQNKGIFNGVLLRDAKEKYKDFFSSLSIDSVYSEGESLRDLYERMKGVLNTIMEEEDDTLFVTHRGVINMLYYLLYDKELDNNKGQFGVEHASIHALSKETLLIKRIK